MDEQQAAGPAAADGRVYTWRIQARAVAPVVLQNLHTLADDKQFTHCAFCQCSRSIHYCVV